MAADKSSQPKSQQQLWQLYRNRMDQQFEPITLINCFWDPKFDL